MKKVLLELPKWLAPPAGHGVRDMIVLFCLAQAVLRLIPGMNISVVAILPSQVYGALMLLLGVALSLTSSCVRRSRRLGQLVAALTSVLWLVLALDVTTASWGSMATSFIIALAAANEVRANEC
jgi:hypothetical protein